MPSDVVVPPPQLFRFAHRFATAKTEAPAISRKEIALITGVEPSRICMYIREGEDFPLSSLTVRFF